MTPRCTKSALSRTVERIPHGIAEVRSRDGWMHGATLPLPASLSRWLGVVLVVLGLFSIITSVYWLWWDSQPLNYLTDRLFMRCIAKAIIGSVLVVGGLILSFISYMAVQSSMMRLRLKNECDSSLYDKLEGRAKGLPNTQLKGTLGGNESYEDSPRAQLSKGD